MFAFNLGPSQILILLLLGVLLFGNRLPEVGRTLAKTLREFRNAWRGLEDDLRGTMPRLDAPVPGVRVSPRITSELRSHNGEMDGSAAG